MKHKISCMVCLLLSIIVLSGCTTENDQMRMPWEKETEPEIAEELEGSVSDKIVDPTMPEQDDDLPYWIIPVSSETGGIFYEDEEERNAVIAEYREGYDMLKQALWNSDDPDVHTNGNIQTLAATLSKIKAEDRPRNTYAQMKVAGLCENLDQYFGDLMWWDAITVQDCKVIEDETADTLNEGKPYALVTAETYYKETIYLYVMDAEAGSNYYGDPCINNLRGYPVGVSGDAIVLCMIPFEGAGG